MSVDRIRPITFKELLKSKDLGVEVFRLTHFSCEKVVTREKLVNSDQVDPATGDLKPRVVSGLYCEKHKVSSLYE